MLKCPNLSSLFVPFGMHLHKDDVVPSFLGSGDLSTKGHPFSSFTCLCYPSGQTNLTPFILTHIKWSQRRGRLCVCVARKVGEHIVVYAFMLPFFSWTFVNCDCCSIVLWPYRDTIRHLHYLSELSSLKGKVGATLITVVLSSLVRQVDEENQYRKYVVLGHLNNV